MFSCRGCTNEDKKCPVAVADLGLLHNHVMHSLVNPAAAKGSPFYFWESIHSSLKTNYMTFYNACDNGITNMSPEFRVQPMNEETSTTITQAGFILQWKGEKSKTIPDQELCDIIFETQFLKHHKERYHKLCSKFAICEKASKTKKGELEDFKALLHNSPYGYRLFVGMRYRMAAE